MPVYEYKCANDHRIELTRSMFDPDLEENCKECNEPLRKVFHAKFGVEIDDGNNYNKLRKKEFGFK